MISPIPTKKEIKAIAEEIKASFNEVIFNPLSDITGIDIIENSDSPILRDLDKDKIEFVDGVLKGSFSVASIKYLESLKQPYNGKKRGYKIEDTALLLLLSSKQASFLKVKDESLEFLRSFEEVNLGIKRQPMEQVVSEVSKKAISNLDDVVQQPNNQDIEDDFIDTVRDSSDTFIAIMTSKLINDIIKAKSTKQLVKSLNTRKGQASRKATTIATDQSFYYSGRVRRQTYQDNNVRMFKWKTKGDSHVRDSHAELNGEVFAYEDPPLVDGVQLLPSDAFGCRCEDEPVIKGLK